MVNVERSQPAPKSLEIEKQKEKGKLKKEGDYRKKDVFERLLQDSGGKCFICENGEMTAINIEHIRPHEGKDLNRKFDWNNLAFACAHCNQIKSNKYLNMWDCTNANIDIEAKVACRIRPFPKEKVEIENLDDSEESDETMSLLIAVYNGGTERTLNQKAISAKIRGLLLTEVRVFQDLLFHYYDAPKDKSYWLERIKDSLHSKSRFSGFKRRIVSDRKEFLRDFGIYLEQR